MRFVRSLRPSQAQSSIVVIKNLASRIVGSADLANSQPNTLQYIVTKHSQLNYGIVSRKTCG